MTDKIIRATAANGMIRAFAAQTTELIECARKLHNLEPAAAAALGRTLTAVAMMSIDMKNDKDTVSAIIRGNGPIGSVVTVGNAKGQVKGYVGNPQATTQLNEQGKIDVAHVIGNEASLTVIKDLGLKEPYSGQISMQSGEIAEDFAYYFTVSEQKPSAVGLGVLVEIDNSIKAAGGFIIQPMPGATDEIISRLEQAIATMEPVSSQINNGCDCIALLKSILGDMDLVINDELEPSFKCNCSRERLENIILSMDKKELMQIIKEDKGIEMVCHYCNKKYNFSEQQCMDIINK